ncbi:MAG TPA: hypothetical protein VNN17_02125, partial [Terriglobia bacterium]|nr:hypothetical protein [Terriglobia bacterium]
AYQANDANGDGIFDSYTEYAAPTQNNVTGVTVFCVDQTNVVFRDPGGTGSSAGPTTAGQVCSGGNWVPL